MRKPILLTAALCVMFGVAAKAQAQSAQTSNAPVNGASVGDFFGGSATVNPESMERASIPADQAVNLGPDHNVKAPIPGEPIRKHKFLDGIGRAYNHIFNFPSGRDNSVDASLSSNLKNEENEAKIQQIESAQTAVKAEKAKTTSQSTSSSQQ